MYGNISVFMKERKIEISHYFLFTFQFSRHKWKGTIRKQEVDKKMEVGFLWQTDFQGSWVSPHKASRSVPPSNQLSIHHVSRVKLIKFQSGSKGGNRSNGGKDMYSKLAEIISKIS